MQKSILDGIQVDDKAFPLHKVVEKKCEKQVLIFAGGCPECGAPIYGPSWVEKGEPVHIEYNCSCRLQRKSFMGQMQTK